MSSTQDFTEYVCEQVDNRFVKRYKKMFGEYIVYINEKPVLLVCDNVVFVKILPEIAELMESAEKGYPYKDAKEHYILDIENKEQSNKVIEILEKITPLPKLITKLPHN
jgi:TfoX/Sxy family transcriptional regulator of competence genes